MNPTIRRRRVLILGYGALGVAFFRLYNTRYEIRGIKRSPLLDDPCPLVLAPIRSEALLPLVEWADDIIFCPSSGRGNLACYRETYLGNMVFLIKQVRRRKPPLPHLILIGSTGVYPRSQDKTWHENDNISIESDRQEILLRTEQAVVTSDVPYTILRSGGLYSLARGYFYRYIREGKICTSEMSDQWVLSVHQDDLCGVIHRVIGQEREGPVGEIYNVVDNSLLRRRELAQWISQEKGVPILSDGPAPPAPERRVSNQKVKDVLGYTFQYASIIQFLKDHFIKNNQVP
ncbi:MAG: hypothetical protein ABGX83_04200 [Nitrospira sp.]|nr:hypothetical protein [Candidatus Manganitrophaceae bacterium]HIL34713.1 hypothetical protein [Candidatus Manganitrophaceae bacterium]